MTTAPKPALKAPKCLFVQAANFTDGRDGVKPRLIVLHTMEAPETHTRAEQVAAWFAGKTAPDASVHYCVDDNSIVQTLAEHDTAWAVGNYRMNRLSINIEMAGYAGQDRPEWADEYSLKMMRRVARLVVAIAGRHKIPLTKISARDIADGRAGLCGHRDITKAMQTPGGHTDPGPDFPWADFMQLILIEKGSK